MLSELSAMPDRRIERDELSSRINPYVPVLYWHTGRQYDLSLAQVCWRFPEVFFTNNSSVVSTIHLKPDATLPTSNEAHALRDSLREEMYDVAMTTARRVQRPQRTHPSEAVVAALAALQRAPALTQPIAVDAPPPVARQSEVTLNEEPAPALCA